MDDRKCVVLSVVGVDGVQAMYACDFREEMLVSLWNVGGGVDRGCEEVAKRLVEFER
jgi:hypothetical protein